MRELELKLEWRGEGDDGHVRVELGADMREERAAQAAAVDDAWAPAAGGKRHWRALSHWAL